MQPYARNSLPDEKDPAQKTDTDLLRVYADNCDCKRLVMFWLAIASILFCFSLLSSIAIPTSLLHLNHFLPEINSSISNCTNPKTVEIGSYLQCEHAPGLVSQVLHPLSRWNQFAQVDLVLTPNVTLIQKLKSVNILNLTLTLELSVLELIPGVGSNKTKVILTEILSRYTSIFNLYLNNNHEYQLIRSKPTTQHRLLLGYIAQLDDTRTLFVQATITGKDPLLTQVFYSSFIDSFVAQRHYTYFAIGIRLAYFMVAVAACIAYFWRLSRIPHFWRLYDQKAIGAMSIGLLFLNDPFYAITVLFSNFFNVFLSIIFISFFMTCLLMAWVFLLRRVTQNEYGKSSSKVFDRLFIAECVALMIVLIVHCVAQTATDSSNHPILAIGGEPTFLFAAKMVVFLVFGAIVIQVLYLMLCACKQNKVRLTRTKNFIYVTGLFILVILLTTVRVGIKVFEYSAPTLLFLLSFINAYVLYMMYMYTVTRSEVENIRRGAMVMMPVSDRAQQTYIDYGEGLQSYGKEPADVEPNDIEIKNYQL